MSSSLPQTPGRFPRQGEALFNALKGQGDVAIADLFHAVYPDRELGEKRDMQARLGPFITRLNRRLKGEKQVVRPGHLKGTYRLDPL